jgi:putative component of membrane protein insertase Oxa1/YidC/SpoIIIJ protein YidD
VALAVRRLARCHPITFLGGGSGPDPVPRARHRAP